MMLKLFPRKAKKKRVGLLFEWEKLKVELEKMLRRAQLLLQEREPKFRWKIDIVCWRNDSYEDGSLLGRCHGNLRLSCCVT